MSEEDELLVVLCTAPDQEAARALAKGIVEARLAACVNVIPGVKSFYHWQGALQADSEVQLVIKTRRGRFDELAAWIEANHPYDVPEVVALPADRVNESYLRWAVEESS